MADFSYAPELLLRLGLAVVCGMTLGYERERHGRSAGLRTNLLVCVGSALMTIVSEHFYRIYGGSLDMTLRMDPARIAAQIVVGIGFIGAGVIIKEQGGIRGLTTAATLWLVAGLGMTCGVGMYFIAATTTLIALIALTILKQYERHIPRDYYRVVEVTCDEKENDVLPVLMDFLRTRKLDIKYVNYNHTTDDSTTIYQFSISCKISEDKIVETVKELPRFGFISQVKLT
ncbi:MAG TPA: MgtC/SapB family protein [Geobacteraceae bacterium]|nr:MgtC/SapB family protein [Geobacteraceae bacterium]